MILDRIVADTRALLSERKRHTPESALRERIADLPAPRSLVDALQAPGVSVIAEIKRASPSKGALNGQLDPREQAGLYAAAGADAISVLTEPAHFCGSLGDLASAREGLAQDGRSCPLLRKDFHIDPYQLYEARAWGADAVLLIVAALDDARLAALHDLAQDLGLTALVEVHDEAELARAAKPGPALIGINNRNLRDFSVSLETTRRLRDSVPQGCLVISESGIKAPEQMALLAEMAVDGALIGEALVTSDNPGATLQLLKEAGR